MIPNLPIYDQLPSITLLLWWDFQNTVEIAGSGIEIPADICLWSLVCKWNRTIAVEGMKPNWHPASPFHLRLLFLEHQCVNLAGHVKTWGHRPWASGQDIPAGLAAAVCSQTAWRAAEFSFMDWSINGAFLLCPDVDFHNVCGGWYLWNISSAKLVRISLWVWNYLDRIWQTEILSASFL